MNENKTWTCDSCGQPIQDSSHGWVEWLVRKDGDKYIGRGLRLVHGASAHKQMDGRCQYHERLEYQRDGSILSDLDLKSFLGADGLITLLGMIAAGELPADEVLELTKRLHVPGYEQARFHFDEAIAEGVFEPSTMPGYYSLDEINAVLKFIRKP